MGGLPFQRGESRIGLWLLGLVPLGQALLAGEGGLKLSLLALAFLGLARGRQRFFLGLGEEGQTIFPGTRRVLGWDHTPFEPIPLWTTGASREANKAGWTYPALTLVLVVLVGVLWPREETMVAPIPTSVSAEGAWDYETVLEREGLSALPDSLAYLKHRFFQETFLYGESFRLPDLGFEVSVPEYSFENGVVKERDKVYFTLSSQWVEEEFDKMSEGGLTKLLRTEPAPPLVKVEERTLRGVSPQLLVGVILYAALVFVFWFSHIGVGNLPKGEVGVLLASRRKRQVA